MVLARYLAGSLSAAASILLLSGCTENTTDDSVAHQTAALTSAPDKAPASPTAFEPSWEFNSYAAASGQPSSPSATLNAAQHPGHFTNKRITKATPTQTSAGSVAQPPAASANYQDRQRTYLAQWQVLQSSEPQLPPDELERRRIELKTSLLGGR
jgi:hypothetical protein